MIFYLATADDRHRFVAPLSYDEALRARRLRAGTYVFADLERLGPRDAERAAGLWRALADAAPADVRLLNHPTRTMRRYQLLRYLFESGRNAFDVYRLTEARGPRRFPVFMHAGVRPNHERSPLLATEADLAAALADVDRRARSRETVTITELCDTVRADGCYRTHAALIVGERVLPWRVSVTRTWDGSDGAAEESRRLTRTYLDDNPHAATLAEIAAAARVEWGMVEYGLLDGRVQVWGIDTDPGLLAAGGADADAESDELRMRRLREAFAARDPREDGKRQPWIATGSRDDGRLRAFGRGAYRALRERARELGDRLPRR